MMRRVLHDVSIVEVGALDDLSDDEIVALAPGERDYVLVSRLRDGREVALSREKIFPLVQAKLDGLSEETDIVVFLCTGEFPDLRCDRLLIEPEKLLFRLTQSVATNRRLGVLVPHPSQIPTARRRWLRVTSTLVVGAKSPYQADDAGKEAQALRDAAVELVVMDCIGYTDVHKRQITAALGVPVIMASSATARIIQELLP